LNLKTKKQRPNGGKYFLGRLQWLPLPKNKVVFENIFAKFNILAYFE